MAVLPEGALTILAIAIILLCFASARLITILPPFRAPPTPRKLHNASTHLLVVLGSGGHTAEMLTMLVGLDTQAYSHRTYVVGEGDHISAAKAKSFEGRLQEHARVQSRGNAEREKGVYGTFVIATVPRARRIHQSLLTTPFSCLWTLLAALRLLSAGPPLLFAPIATAVPKAPSLILTNGPATSAIVVLASLILRFFDFSGASGHAATRIVYIESFARIETLSLSAKCVGPVVDRLIVQWEQLHGKLRGKAEYGGLLVMRGVQEGR